MGGRRINPGRPGTSAPAHPAIQQAGAFITGAFKIDRHAGNRRRRQLTDQFIVVHADDSHLVGHVQPGRFAGLDQMTGIIIVASHHPNRLGQRFQPSSHGQMFGSPGSFAPVHRRVKKMTLLAGSFQAPLKTFPAGGGPGNATGAAEGEMIETATEQVPGCQMSGGFGIGDDMGDIWKILIAMSHNHGGDAQGQEPSGHLCHRAKKHLGHPVCPGAARFHSSRPVPNGMPRDRGAGRNWQNRATGRVPTRGTIPTAKPPAATFPYGKTHPCRKRLFCNPLTKMVVTQFAISVGRALVWAKSDEDRSSRVHLETRTVLLPLPAWAGRGSCFHLMRVFRCARSSRAVQSVLAVLAGWNRMFWC